MAGVTPVAAAVVKAEEADAARADVSDADKASVSCFVLPEAQSLNRCNTDPFACCFETICLNRVSRASADVTSTSCFFRATRIWEHCQSNLRWNVDSTRVRSMLHVIRLLFTTKAPDENCKSSKFMNPPRYVREKSMLLIRIYLK